MSAGSTTATPAPHRLATIPPTAGSRRGVKASPRPGTSAAQILLFSTLNDMNILLRHVRFPSTFHVDAPADEIFGTHKSVFVGWRSAGACVRAVERSPVPNG